MNPWSIRRKRIILSIILVALIIIIGVPLYLFTRTTPTCFDGKQNGDETGIDCGGSCKLLCSADSLPIIIKGDARLLKIATTTYEAVVSLENPNAYGSIKEANYTFKIYSASSTVPIKIIQGKAYVPKASTFALFEGPFDMGEASPNRATFEWQKNTLVWERDDSKVPSLKIETPVLTNVEASPKLDAVVQNTSLNRVSNIELVALVYDSADNIIGASKTFVDTLLPNDSSPIVFVWPNPFLGIPVRELVLPRILPSTNLIN